MRKLRERFKGKKGFTLVELIVVIVIILILAAVLIPNVMRYIDSARKSAFQSEASGYLTEITGYEAEYYAETAKDATNDILTTSADRIGGTNRPLTGFPASGTVKVIKDAATRTNFPLTASGAVAICAWVDNGGVKAFTYTDGTHFVSWDQEKGWTNVDSKDFK